LAWRYVGRAGCNLAISFVTTVNADTATPIGLAAAVPTAKFSSGHR
jgi:hypothetical protein